MRSTCYQPYRGKGFVNMKIKGGGLKTWVKTRWGSLYLTTDSMLRARPVFDCRSVRSVWQPEVNNFKLPAIHVFNRRYEEFLHPLYILAYYIHPEYRGKNFHNNLS